MVSVIIPVYNTEKYLRRSLDSVLASGYRDFELILIDDGSTDRSPMICDEYSARDSRVRVIHQENRGVSAARNRGMDVSRGEWIVFVDSDDWITPDFLGMVAREEYKTADFLLFNYRKPGEKTLARRHPPEPVYFEGKDIRKLIRRILQPRQLAKGVGGRADFRGSWARAYRKSMIDRYKIRFSQSLRIGEDQLFNMEYQLRIRSCIYVPAPVYIYNLNDESTTYGYLPGLVKNHAVLQRELKRLLVERRLFSEFKKDFYAYSLENLAFVLVREVFSPSSPRTFAADCRLCSQMQRNRIYKKAMAYNAGTGILPRKALVLFFRLRWYRMVFLVCQLSNIYLKRKNFLL